MNSAQRRQQQPQSPEEKLAQAQADADHWSQVAALPGLSPQAAAWAFNLARSAKAEVALRLKALQPDTQSPDPTLMRLLGLDNPPQDQPSASRPTTPSLRPPAARVVESAISVDEFMTRYAPLIAMLIEAYGRISSGDPQRDKANVAAARGLSRDHDLGKLFGKWADDLVKKRGVRYKRSTKPSNATTINCRGQPSLFPR